MTSFPTQEPKKRGRPSKKDVERKQQEAIARGDIIPPAPSMGYQMPGEEVSVAGYAPIRPAVTPTLQYAPSPGIPIEREIPESAGSPGKRRRLKAAPKAPKVGSDFVVVENANFLKDYSQTTRRRQFQGQSPNNWFHDRTTRTSCLCFNNDF